MGKTPNVGWIATWLVFAAVPAAALDVVYVTRHAQKDLSPSWNPIGDLRPLSTKGAACAGGMSRLLEGRGVAAVYASETARTLSTGAALSTTHDGVEIVGDDATTEPTPELARELRERHAGDQAILIVGHSNTVTDLVLAFRPDVEACLERLRLKEPGATRNSISEKQYGDVWRVELGAGQTDCEGVTREHVGRVGDVDCSTP